MLKRRKKSRLSFVVLTVLCFLLISGTAWAGWTGEETPERKSLYGVWGSSGSDVFAVGSSGTILHYNGSAWTSMTSGTTNNLYGVWGSSGKDVFAVGYGVTILHYNGSAWTSMNPGTTNLLAGVWGSSGKDVFAVGGMAGYDGTILHYNGSAWTAMASGMANQVGQRLRRRGRPASAIWYIGVGPSHASIHSDYSAIGSKSAGGYALLAGVEFADTWSVEMFVSGGHHITTGATENIYYPPDKAMYSVVAFSIRKSIWSLDENWWTPWIAVGLGIGQVSWDTYFYELTGDFTPAFSGGVDIRIGKSPLAVRAQVMTHSFSATDPYDYGPYEVTGRLFSAVLMYWFR